MATGYITGHRHRSSATILVHYYLNGSPRSVEVPITPRSLRRFMLMQDDFVQLEFSLAEPISFGIGSYINDTIFGAFYIISEQMPRYNKQTGGYDYSLRFEAPYMRWKNFLHCLVSGNKRMETSWSLTDKLDVHAQQIADNVNIALPPTVTEQTDSQTMQTTYTSTGYVVSVDAANAADIKHIQYDGMDIISAMNAIAEAYGCEWWVDDEQRTIGTTTYLHTIHFGKCELDNSGFTFIVGDNVESMDISRDQQTFCNRIFAYGGTRNIPENYDRKLLFTADTVTKYRTQVTSVKDSQRPLTLDMIQGEGSVTPSVFTFGDAQATESGLNRSYKLKSDTKSLSGNQTIFASLSSSFSLLNDDWAGTDIPQVSVTAFVYYGSSLKKMHVSLNENQFIVDGKTWYADISLDYVLSLGSTAQNVYVEVVWNVTFGYQSEHLNDEWACGISGTLTATADASTATKPVKVYYNNTEYSGTFSGATGVITFGTTKPPASLENNQYTVSPLNILKVPLSWYTLDYDFGTMRMAGEKRLHLPLADYPNRYIDTQSNQSEHQSQTMYNTSNASQVVESAVVFNEVYPRLKLRIKQGSLSQTAKKQKVEHSDGSVTWEDWTQYSFKAEYNNNGTWADFPFSLEYMLDGEKLQAVFTAPESAQASGFLLSGMTFDVGFSQGWNGSTYTIIRNEEYGTLLPNNILKPTELDEFVLTGWNPVAMNELGIVDAAEQELATKAEEYLAAIREGQFTFTCRMMSDIFWKYAYGGRDAQGTTPKTYGLLQLGAKVTISNAALPNGSKTSRIIGYEYKLDIPYDTPMYTVGETEAFSRLKQIEKQLTKL